MRKQPLLQINRARPRLNQVQMDQAANQLIRLHRAHKGDKTTQRNGQSTIENWPSIKRQMVAHRAKGILDTKEHFSLNFIVNACRTLFFNLCSSIKKKQL